MRFTPIRRRCPSACLLYTSKLGQLGTLDEVLALCGVDKRITPCIDFGHLNARTLGGIQTKADYAAILDRMAEVLGDDRARQFHVHFSRIEYSAGGEKRHWTFADTQFGPEPQPLMELLAERQLTPVVICESAGTQAEDGDKLKYEHYVFVGFNVLNKVETKFFERLREAGKALFYLSLIHLLICYALFFGEMK